MPNLTVGLFAVRQPRSFLEREDLTHLIGFHSELQHCRSVNDTSPVFTNLEIQPLSYGSLVGGKLDTAPVGMAGH